MDTGAIDQPLPQQAPVPSLAVTSHSPRAVMVTLVLSPSPDCSFTCHYRCRALVRLDCSGPPGAGNEDDGSEQALEKDTNVVGSGPCLQGRVRAAVANRGLPAWGVRCWALPCSAT